MKVEISLSFENRALLAMFLESPYGTRSQLIYTRVYDALYRRKRYDNLVVTTLHFWGENATAKEGKWKLSFESDSFRFRHVEGIYTSGFDRFEYLMSKVNELDLTN